MYYQTLDRSFVGGVRCNSVALSLTMVIAVINRHEMLCSRTKIISCDNEHICFCKVNIY